MIVLSFALKAPQVTSHCHPHYAQYGGRVSSWVYSACRKPIKTAGSLHPLRLLIGVECEKVVLLFKGLPGFPVGYPA